MKGERYCTFLLVLLVKTVLCSRFYCMDILNKTSCMEQERVGVRGREMGLLDAPGRLARRR